MFFVLLYFCLILSVHQLVGFSFSEEKRKNAETIICFLLLYLFFGFRDLTILNDTAHYYAHFEDAIALIHSKDSIFDVDRFDRMEKGYLVFENILATITDQPYLIINLSALLISISVVFLISRFSSNIGIICFLLLGTSLLNVFSGVRQGIASCFVLFAIFSMIKNKHVMSLFLFVFASLFHSSALLIMIVIQFYRMKLNKYTISFLAIAIYWLFPYLEDVGVLLGRDDSAYFNATIERETLPFASILNFLVSFLFLLSIVCMNIKNKTKWDSIYWWIITLNCLFLMLDIFVKGMYRFSLYLYPFTLVFWWKNILLCEKTFHQLNLKIFFCILIFIKLFIIIEFRPEWYHLTPYSTYDFSQKVHDTNFDY